MEYLIWLSIKNRKRWLYAGDGDGSEGSWVGLYRILSAGRQLAELILRPFSGGTILL